MISFISTVKVNGKQVLFKKSFKMATINFQTKINPILKCCSDVIEHVRGK